MNLKNLKTIGLVSCLVLASGCASTQAEWETTEMGTAVADLIVNQIANPEAGLDDPAPEGGQIDGEKAARSLEAYRAALPGADAGTGEVVINIGK